MDKNKTTTIVGTALLTAILVVLQILSNYITIGTVSINLSMIPIVIGAILYGPAVGLFLGLVDGLVIIFSPSTQAIFFPITIVGTVIVCLLKTGLAGFVAGYIYRVFKNNNNKLGIVLATLLVPMINTGLFSVAALTIFRSFLESLVSVDYANIYVVLLFLVIGVNFIVEFSLNAILSPTIIYIINIRSNRRHSK